MTTTGSQQSYAAGNKVYGFGRSNPTSGPVDPLGYRERNLSQNSFQAAAGRRLGNHPTPLAAQHQQKQQAMQGLGAQVRPQATPTGTIGTSVAPAHLSVPTPITRQLPAGGSLEHMPQVQPSSGNLEHMPQVQPAPFHGTAIQGAPAGYVDPAGPQHMQGGGMPNAMATQTSQGVPLTQPQQNSQQVENQWNTAHGLKQVSYDNQFNQPISEINGQIVPNAGYRPDQPGAGGYAPHAPQPENGQSVAGGLPLLNGNGLPNHTAFNNGMATGQPGNSAQAPGMAGQQTAPGLSNMGDNQYQQQMAQLASQVAAARGQYAQGANDVNTSVYGQERDINNQAPKDYQDILEKFAGHGMAHSGAYVGALGDAQQGTARSLADLEQGKTHDLNALLQQLTGANQDYNSGVGNASTDLAGRLAANAGHLGLDNTHPAPAAPDLSSLLNKLNPPKAAPKPAAKPAPKRVAASGHRSAVARKVKK